jgi:biopolymer transport protein ExbD
MGRPKIARKSTRVDMTAFCDVAFLLLSFFIMATKQKPPEAIKVMMPSSVNTKAVEDVNQVMVTLNDKGKVFLSFSEPERRVAVLDAVTKLKGLSLGSGDLAKAKTAEFFGAPISQMQSFLNLPAAQLTGDKLPGIPCTDSTNNELTAWMTAVSTVFAGDKMNLFLKGDNNAKYPVFKQVMEAFKANDLLKFKIITNSEAVPPGSEYSKKQAATAEKK